MTTTPNWGLAAVRWLALLSLIVWLGGLTFLGAVAAPAIFKINFILGPQMVGAMLGRFTPVIYGCAVLLVATWWAEWGLSGLARAGTWPRRLWSAQGVGIFIMAGCACYLGLAVMPRIVRLQPRIVAAKEALVLARHLPPRALLHPPQSIDAKAAGPVDPQVKAEFDALHERYTSLTSVSVWLGLAVAALLCGRWSVPTVRHREF